MGGQIMLLSFKLKSSKSRFLVVARLICVVVLFSFTYCGGPQDAAAQFDGGGGGGGIDPGDLGFPTDGGDFGGGGGDLGGGGNFGGNIGGGSGVFGDDFGNVLGGEETTDLRNQGFVGPTGTRIQENGFIGQPGELSGPPLSDGASFGGGTNDVGSGGGTGGGGGRRNNQNQNTGFGGTGQVKGFQVFRSSVRANLRPQFSSPRASGSRVADRFQNRIRRIPNMGNDGAGVQISIANQTATIQGFVGSAEERSRIERQLRLEPGVYRVNNQSQIVSPYVGP